jgi:hypothetical protein
MVGSGFPERIGGTISESLLAPDREASRAFPKRAEVDASPVPIAATIALEMIGPIPGTVITLRCARHGGAPSPDKPPSTLRAVGGGSAAGPSHSRT